MTTDTTPTNPHRGHPEGTVYQTEDGRYWLRGRFGSTGLDGPEPTAKEIEHLEEWDYPYGRDIFFIPITTEGETWQLDLPSCCIDLAARTGIPNDVMAQHFVDVAAGHFRELLPLCSDRQARSEQISIVADRVIWRALCGGCREMETASYRQHVECARDGQAVSGVTTDEIALYFSGPSDVIPFTIPRSAAGRKMLRDQLSVVYLDPESYEPPKPVTVEGDEADREIAEQIAHDEWYARFEQKCRRYEILSSAIWGGDDDGRGRAPAPRPSPAPAAA
jgi:hypothetical protein